MTTKEAAVDVWRVARAAVSGEPTPERIQRVRGKVADLRAFLVVLNRDESPVGMALAEPYRSANGFGTVQPGHGHISMVFVRPEQQGSGIGTELVERIIADAPWPCLSLWADKSAPTQTLRRLGFRATAETRSSGPGVCSQRWERSAV